jgi:hypothetical protein
MANAAAAAASAAAAAAQASADAAAALAAAAAQEDQAGADAAGSAAEGQRGAAHRRGARSRPSVVTRPATISRPISEPFDEHAMDLTAEFGFGAFRLDERRRSTNGHRVPDHHDYGTGAYRLDERRGAGFGPGGGRGGPYADPGRGRPYSGPISGVPYTDPGRRRPYPDSGRPYPDSGRPYSDSVGGPYTDPGRGWPYTDPGTGGSYADSDRDEPFTDGDGSDAGNVYRARRPGAVIMLTAPAVLIALLLLRGLFVSAFGSPFQLGGVIASLLTLTALPLLVIGFYGLLTGAAQGATNLGIRVWARPPLSHLPLAVVLLLVAGIAAK